MLIFFSALWGFSMLLSLVFHLGIGYWLHKDKDIQKTTKTNPPKDLAKNLGEEATGEIAEATGEIAEATGEVEAQIEVTVLICVRNGGWSLARFLPSIWAQKANFNWELLIIDDDSQDGTAAMLTNFAPRSRRDRSGRARQRTRGMPKNLKERTKERTNKRTKKKAAAKNGENKIFRILSMPPKQKMGKKEALNAGVLAAKGTWILVTDADCKPASAFWLAEMWAETSAPKTTFVLGFSPYLAIKKNKKKAAQSSILSDWQQFEALITWLQYATLAFFGSPYMGVGRNMMYKKTAFLGYDWRKNENLASGDDDLLVNALATGENTRLCTSPRAWVWSVPKADWRGYSRQKQRHFSTASRYRFLHKILLGGWAQAQILTWLFLVGFVYIYSCTDVLVSLSLIFLLLIFLLALRLLIVGIVWRKAARKFGLPNIKSWRLLIFDPLLALFYLLFAPILLFGSKIMKWK